MPSLPKFSKTKMFRQGFFVLSGIFVIAIAVLLICGYLYAQKGKAELAAIKAEIREAGGKLTFDDFDIEPEEIETDGFVLLKDEVEKLSDILREINEELGRPDLKTELIGVEKQVQHFSPQDIGFKNGLSWKQIQSAHKPLME